MPPQYIYEHPATSEIVEVFQKMNDVHKHFTEEDGEQIEWKRVWTKPQMSIDTKVDAYSAKDFAKVTNKPGTYGELLDRSKEMSDKREEKEGVDPVKTAYFDKYKKDTGKKHLADKPKKIETSQAIIEL